MLQIKVRELLGDKGHDVVAIEPDATVFDAIAKMVDHNVGSIVVAEEDQVVGIFTERDYLRKIALKGRTSSETSVTTVMTTDVICVDPDYTIEECLAIMTENKCRHLPVMSDGELNGIVSIGDCVKRLSQDALERVSHLEEYITGEYPR